MKITKLDVSFHEKDQAKKLGAGWNCEEKFWFITENQDKLVFKKWLPTEDINLKVEEYYIAESTRICWKCRYKSSVYAIVLPKKSIYSKVSAKVIYYLKYIDENAQKRFKILSSHYYYDHAQHQFYWMNHCKECKAKFGDFETIEEYISSFNPKSIEEANKITLYYINEPLRAFGVSKDIFFFKCMKISEDPYINSSD